jgi:hypothetical protein
LYYLIKNRSPKRYIKPQNATDISQVCFAVLEHLYMPHPQCYSWGQEHLWSPFTISSTPTRRPSNYLTVLQQNETGRPSPKVMTHVLEWLPRWPMRFGKHSDYIHPSINTAVRTPNLATLSWCPLETEVHHSQTGGELYQYCIYHQRDAHCQGTDDSNTVAEQVHQNAIKCEYIKPGQRSRYRD